VIRMISIVLLSRIGRPTRLGVYVSGPAADEKPCGRRFGKPERRRMPTGWSSATLVNQGVSAVWRALSGEVALRRASGRSGSRALGREGAGGAVQTRAATGHSVKDAGRASTAGCWAALAPIEWARRGGGLPGSVGFTWNGGGAGEQVLRLRRSELFHVKRHSGQQRVPAGVQVTTGPSSRGFGTPGSFGWPSPRRPVNYRWRGSSVRSGRP
jgi:hypothetical protein